MGRDKEVRKRAKFGLLDKAHQLAITGETHQKCGLIPIGARVQIVEVSKGDHDFANLHSCRSAWCCPRCTNAKMAEKGEILRNVQKLIDVPVKPTMITYTIQHSRDDTLKDSLELIKNSLRISDEGSRRKHVNRISYGSVTVIEITWTEENGWHVHAHRVMYLYPETTRQELHKYVISPYIKTLSEHRRIVNGVTVKVDPWIGGVDYVTKGSKISSELTAGSSKSSVNIMTILGWAKRGNKWHGRYLEFCKATKRRKVMNMTKNIRRLYKIESEKYEKQKKKKLQDLPIVHTMKNSEWMDLKRSGMHYEIIAMLDNSREMSV